jgi:hypothetical protein
MTVPLCLLAQGVLTLAFEGFPPALAELKARPSASKRARRAKMS